MGEAQTTWSRRRVDGQEPLLKCACFSEASWEDYLCIHLDFFFKGTRKSFMFQALSEVFYLSFLIIYVIREYILSVEEQYR